MAFEGLNNLGVTVGSFQNWLKKWYIDQNNLNILMYEGTVLGRLKRLPATEIVGGEDIVVPVRIGRNPNASKNFGVAQKQAKARTGARGRWVAPIDHDFAVCRIEQKSILASEMMRGAFAQSKADEMEASIEGLRDKRSVALFAKTENSAGTISAKGTNQITMTRSTMTASLDVNDQIVFAAPGASALRSATPLTVEAVNRKTGVVTLSGNPHSTVAPNDNVYREGDFGETAMQSFATFLPTSITNANKTLFGLDRSIDPVRLGGFFYQMTATETFSTAIRKQVANIINLTGKAPNVIYCNANVEALMAIELETGANGTSNNVRIDISNGGVMQTTRAGVGRVEFNTGKGIIPVVTDPFCDVEDVFILNEDTWGLYYLASKGDDFVHFYKHPTSGDIIITAYDANGVEIRVNSFGQLLCKAPGCNARLKLDSGRITRALK